MHGARRRSGVWGSGGQRGAMRIREPTEANNNEIAKRRKDKTGGNGGQWAATEIRGPTGAKRKETAKTFLV